MAYVPNTAAPFAVKPTAFSTAVPAAAKVAFSDATNTAVLVPPMVNNIQVFGSLFVLPANTFTSGRLMLYRYDGANYFAIDDIAITGVSISTTVPFAKLPFTQWTPAAPLILPEGSSLLIATSVAQTAGSLIAHAQLGKVF